MIVIHFHLIEETIRVKRSRKFEHGSSQPPCTSCLTHLALASDGGRSRATAKWAAITVVRNRPLPSITITKMVTRSRSCARGANAFAKRVCWLQICLPSVAHGDLILRCDLFSICDFFCVCLSIFHQTRGLSRGAARPRPFWPFRRRRHHRRTLLTLLSLLRHL
jgi:hypothetical protein